MYPQWRVELMIHLQDLSDQRTRQAWGASKYSHKAMDALGFSVDFIFDTLGLDKEPERMIGVIFFNDEELKAVEDFAERFKVVIESNAEADGPVLQDPRWTEVMQAAAFALNVMRQNERH